MKWTCLVVLGLWSSMLSQARAEGPVPAAPIRAEPTTPATDSPSAASSYGAVATATRVARPLRDVPATVIVLRREEVDGNPALGTDALVRSVPSALTFRRSTSLTADPSSQGLNLRGVGPSGVSRTLVLVDGVPVNDPFGGSIYWRSLPRIGIERVELVPGGGSALYGSAALAGVVQLFSRSMMPSLEADALYGSRRTLQLGARGAYSFRKSGIAMEGEYLRSDGYRVVASDQAGPVDREAESAHGALNVRSTVSPWSKFVLTSSLRLFAEQQNGGTRYTNSEVRVGLLSIESKLRLARDSELSTMLFGRLQQFDQERARIAPERVSETRAARQEVPADDEGAAVVYRSPTLTAAGRHVLSVGADGRRVQGVSRERLYPAVAMADSLRRRDAGGEQLLFGAFLQELYTISERVELSAALRADLFHNRAGSRELGYEDGTRQRERFAARSAYALSPRIGLLVRAHEMLALRGSLYRAFRAPTLNELYRPFQVGTVLTAANEALEPELLHGFEGGAELTPLAGLTLRATGFWNRLDRPISNVSLPAPRADGAERERRNLGHALVRGVETAIEHHFAPYLTTLVAYTLAASEVRHGGASSALRGKRLAQDPVHRASLLLLFDAPKWLSASLQLRVLGEQYEDDLNTLRMRPYALVDLSVSRRVYWNVELFAAVENLFDADYLVGRAGVDTVGQPFAARAGVRIRQR